MQTHGISTLDSGEWLKSSEKILKSRDFPKELLRELLAILGVTEGVGDIERIQIDMNWGGDGLVRSTITKFSPSIDRSL